MSELDLGSEGRRLTVVQVQSKDIRMLVNIKIRFCVQSAGKLA